MKNNLIHTPDYLLVVDDSQIKEGDYCYYLNTLAGGHITCQAYVFDNAMLYDDGTFNRNIGEGITPALGECRKIIAHLPLNNSPVLEGVDLLPPLEQEDDVWKHGLEDELDKLPNRMYNGQYDDGRLVGFEFGATWGFNKAKEKYKYTEEDVEKAIRYGFNIGLGWLVHQKDSYIQTLSQPKIPIGFEVETENYDEGGFSPERQRKTTTNPQGQTVWVGKYIY